MEPRDVGIDALSDDEGLVDAASSPTSQNGLILGKTVKQITYIHIHECEDFSVCHTTHFHLQLIFWIVLSCEIVVRIFFEMIYNYDWWPNHNRQVWISRLESSASRPERSSRCMIIRIWLFLAKYYTDPYG